MGNMNEYFIREGLSESLDDFIHASTVEEHSTKPFVIDNDRLADWAVCEISKKQDRINEAKEVAAARIEKIEAWLQAIEKDNDCTFLLEKLREYALPKLSGKSKTVRMPSGNISFRAVPAAFFVGGEKVTAKNNVLTSWAKENAPDFINVEETTNWTEFKKTLILSSAGQVITTDGEILDFVSVVEYPDSVTVKGA